MTFAIFCEIAVARPRAADSGYVASRDLLEQAVAADRLGYRVLPGFDR